MRSEPGPIPGPLLRCYVGVDVATVRSWRDSGAVPAGTPAFAVTDALRADVGPADPEELEHVAALAAADVAAADVAAADVARDVARPVVLAVDAVAEPTPVAGPAGVRLSGPSPLRRWAAVFAVQSGTGTPGTGTPDEPELSWYAVGELDSLG